MKLNDDLVSYERVIAALEAYKRRLARGKTDIRNKALYKITVNGAISSIQHLKEYDCLMSTEECRSHG